MYLASALQGLDLEITATKAFVACFALIITTTIYKLVYNAYFHPLASLPGPFLYRTTEFPYRWQQVRGRETYILAKLHQKYGHVVRIAPNDVSYTGPEAWKAIYGHHVTPGGSYLSRNLPAGPDMDAYGALGVFNAEGEEHARKRHHFNPAFSDRALREQEPIVMQYINGLMNSFTKKAKTGEPVDLSQWFDFVTFDVIGDIMFGSDVFGCVESSRYHPLVSDLFSRFEAIVLNMAFERIAPPLASLLRILTPNHIKQRQKAHADTIKSLVDCRLNTITNRPDFISFLLSQDRKAPFTAADRNEIYPTASQTMLAGSETIATTLSGCILFLLQHPDAMAKAKQEIRTTYKSVDEINPSALATNKYFLAVLDESMRLYTAVPGHIRRYVPAGGCNILGTFIPEGTFVGFTAYSAYRDESHFKEAEKFIPERWLGTDPQYENDNREMVRPFGYGPMDCIGMNLARFELRMVLARLIWQFDLELMSESRDWFDQKVFIIWYRRPLLVKLVARDLSSKST
ncbi:cytochrome P450 [Hypoxylon trugodes]|uniref:cytochrome P450 n=1 Tax=Hypoxylon trugodes TaxID=326681 RepID=UPI002193FE8A|nr:cytochrome P450 [Hypoxylon trugodes]KAI1383399.1 cytochrome P450 [Hypoxylon trugodes]